MKCKACGDPFDGIDNRIADLQKIGQPIHKQEHLYCLECADEIFRGRLSIRPARLHSSGAGCPLEPNDDAGPWGENAIRNMEDG